MSDTPTAVLSDVDGTLADGNYLYLNTVISRGELLDAGAAEVYEWPAELLAALPESILCPRR
jgi:hypothetical protein